MTVTVFCLLWLIPTVIICYKNPESCRRKLTAFS